MYQSTSDLVQLGPRHTRSSFLVKSRPAVPRHLTRNVTPLSKTPPACWMQTLPKLLNAARSSVVASLVHSSTSAVVTLSRKHATYLVASVVATLFFKILVCSDLHCALIMMAEAEAVAVPLAEPNTMAITTADKKQNTFEAEWEIRCIVAQEKIDWHQPSLLDSQCRNELFEEYKIDDSITIR
jgi:hypothetical protein